MQEEQRWDLILCRVLAHGDAIEQHPRQHTTIGAQSVRFTDHTADASWLEDLLLVESRGSSTGEHIDIHRSMSIVDEAGFTVIIGSCSTRLSPANHLDRAKIRLDFSDCAGMWMSDAKAHLMWDNIAVVVSPRQSGSMSKDLDRLTKELAPARIELQGTGVSVDVASGGALFILPDDQPDEGLVVDLMSGLAFAQIVAARQDRLLVQAMNIRRAIGGVGTRTIGVRGGTLLATNGATVLRQRTSEGGGLGSRDLAASLDWLAVEAGDVRNLEYTLGSGLQGIRVRTFQAFLTTWNSPADAVASKTGDLGQQVMLRHSAAQQNKLTAMLNLIATALATLAVVGLAVDLTWLAGSELVDPTSGPANDGSGLLDVAASASPNTVVTFAAVSALLVILVISAAMKRWQQ